MNFWFGDSVREAHRAAQPAPAALPVLVVLGVGHARLVGQQVEELRPRVVAGRPPVGGAANGGADVDALLGRVGAGQDDGPPGVVDACRPGLVDERLAQQELPVRPVEHVEEAVAVALHEQLARPAPELFVDQQQRLLRVPVVGVVRRELEVPDPSRPFAAGARRRSSCTGCRPGAAPRSGPGRGCRSPSRAGPARRRSCRSATWRRSRGAAPPGRPRSPIPARRAREWSRSATRARRSRRGRRRGSRAGRCRPR